MKKSVAVSLWAIVFLLSACGRTASEGAGGRADGTRLVVDAARDQQAKAILSSKCAACHGFATSPDAMIQQGLIVPGNAQGSKVYQRIAAGSMPPSGKLAAVDIQTIHDWITIDLAPPAPTAAPTVPPTIAPTDVPQPTVAPTVIVPPPTVAPTVIVPPPTVAPTVIVPPPTIAPTVIVPPPTVAPSGDLTYYHDIKPILDAKCAVCHQAGGVDEILLDNYDSVSRGLSLIGAEVAAKKMPPGQSTVEVSPLLDKSRYLTADEQRAILDWIQSGGAAGNAADDHSHAAPILALPRVDASVRLQSPYTPKDGGDDYETFQLPWSVTSDSFVTGFQTDPGPDVHHVLIYAGGASSGGGGLLKVGEYNLLGFRSLIPYIPSLAMQVIFGGGIGSLSGGNNGDGGGSVVTMAGMRLIGAFVPGIGAQRFAPGLGIRVAAGSKIALQIHYNTSHNAMGKAQGPDQTAVHFMLEKSVRTEAVVMPIVNPVWMIKPDTMTIPAGAPSTVASAVVDPFKLFSQFKHLKSLRVFSAIAHMHLRGKRAAINVVQGKKQVGNLLYVPDYDFNFQMNYAYQKPVLIKAGQSLQGVCQWDNSQGDHDIHWGEGTQDEMCLFGVYVAP